MKYRKVVSPSTPHNQERLSATSVPHKNSLRSFHRSDVGNAEVFAALFHDRVRFDHRRKRWLGWQDHWWVEDTDGGVDRLARAVARWRQMEAARIEDPDQQADEFKWALQTENRSKIEALLALAQSETRIADPGTEWDTNPVLFATANGVVDLKTGQLRAGRQSDKITLHSNIEFDPAASCPRWEQFLREIFGGNEELITFIHRAIGYSLTGITGEQVLFLCYGTGANGKSTFLEVLRCVLGKYAYNLPFSSFELRSKTAIPNDIAALEGKRFVTALETNESAPLNEARVKALTGCDPITARYLYQEWFTFVPVAKFWLAFNHKPLVSDDSEGFWRRIRMIPFEHQFSPGTADDQLLSKLQAEAPGILAWAVRGCLDWQQQGLGNPKVVSEATRAYREESNPLSEFLEEKCIIEPSRSVSAKDLWSTYCGWAGANGHQQLERADFATRLKTRGLRSKPVGHNKTRTWFGIGLKTGSPSPPADVRVDAGGDLALLVN